MTSNPLEHARWSALREAGAEWQTVVREAREFRGTAAAKAEARPGEGAWSAAECYAHLNLSLAALLPRMEEALAAAGPARGEPKLDLWGRLLCWSLDPERKFRSKTRAAFSPVTTAPWPSPVDEFLDLHDKLGQLMAASAARDLSVKLRSPFAPIRYTVYSTFRVILVHDRRHQAQARRAAGNATVTSA